MTIDMEEFFHADNLKQCWPPDTWDSAPCRTRETVPRLLEALGAAGVKSTWFVLGWLAEKAPDLVARVAAAGHEIGCHTTSHRLIYEQSPEEFRADLLRATKAITEATGRRPTAFRAPSFSITAKSLWALDVLHDCGFTVDSSIFPVARGLYGIPDFPRDPHVLANGLLEFPLTVLEVRGRALPVAGGGYARLMPNWLEVRLLKQVNAAGRPVVFYCHPWEFDCDEPPSPIPSAQKRFRHYVGRRSFFALFRRLLREMPWTTLTEAARQYTTRQ
jgi:polysaccharide deacetylase family protein (PEP-CTERM system associated)